MRLAIVNDLPLAIEALRRALATSGEHTVVWAARHGAEAVELCRKDRPDVVLMDLMMPVMDGVEATRRIMAESPCAILIVTASVGGNAGKVFEAMGYGALDAVNTPALGISNLAAAAAPLLAKIATIGRLLGDAVKGGRPERIVEALPSSSETDCLVAIGASAGGPAALAEILRQLPVGLGAGVVVVQHVDERFAPGLADWLGLQSSMPVRLARAGDVPVAGTVLVAGTADHLALVSARGLGYTPHPRECAYRPSVDVFFHSVVRHWRGTVVGVLLTGMGRDGAAGLKALRDEGHPTIAQDRATSAVFGMPKAAIELKAAVEILPLNRIAGSVAERVAALRSRTPKEVSEYEHHPQRV